MSKQSKKAAALRYHEQNKPGKIEVIPTKPMSSQRDLALAYSPGVAEPCLEVKNDFKLYLSFLYLFPDIS